VSSNRGTWRGAKVQIRPPGTSFAGVPVGMCPENPGDPMNRDQVKGRMDQAGGKIKEKTGELLNDPEMKNEGTVDKNIGRSQAKVGDLKEKAKDTIDKI
jgi:uncharacterized protein YjbJ (UPF0337 family)